MSGKRLTAEEAAKLDIGDKTKAEHEKAEEFVSALRPGKIVTEEVGEEAEYMDKARRTTRSINLKK